MQKPKTIKKSEIIDRVAKAGFSKNVAKAGVDAILEITQEALAKNKKVNIFATDPDGKEITLTATSSITIKTKKS